MPRNTGPDPVLAARNERIQGFVLGLLVAEATAPTTPQLKKAFAEKFPDVGEGVFTNEMTRLKKLGHIVDKPAGCPPPAARTRAWSITDFGKEQLAKLGQQPT